MLAHNEVLQKLNNLLNKESSELDSESLSGSITNNEFVMSLIPADTQQANFSAALRGTITALNAKKTKVEVYVVRDSATYITFFFSFVAAAAYFIMYFNNQQQTKYIIAGSIALVLGAYFSIWFSNRSVATVQRKFEMFLQKNGLS